MEVSLLKNTTSLQAHPLPQQIARPFMKFSMKKNSPFRNRVYPWIMYALGVISTLSFLTIYLVFLGSLQITAVSLLLLAAGLVLGTVYIIFAGKKVTANRDYLGIRQGMVLTWCVSIVCILFSIFQTTWLYYLGVFIAGFCTAFFWKYTPRFIKIKEQIAADLI